MAASLRCLVLNASMEPLSVVSAQRGLLLLQRGRIEVLEHVTKPAASASSLMCILQGVRLLQVDAMPTCDFSKSSSVNPTAYSIDLAAAFSLPSTTSDE